MVAAWTLSLQHLQMAAVVQDQIVCNFYNVGEAYRETVLCE
jgi:hypothetical protein